MTALRILAAIAPMAAILSFGLPALAAPTEIHVTLNNQPISAELPTNLGMAMPGADMSKAVMSITASPTTIPAGEVTFITTNASADFTHEMILIRIDDPAKQLPYLAGDSMIDEEAAHSMGEVSELDPGKSGTLSADLKPGTYMLLCNVPGHYMAGMWTTITVK